MEHKSATLAKKNYRETPRSFRGSPKQTEQTEVTEVTTALGPGPIIHHKIVLKCTVQTDLNLRKEKEKDTSTKDDTDSDGSVEIVSIGSLDEDITEALDSNEDGRIVYCECSDCESKKVGEKPTQSEGTS